MTFKNLRFIGLTLAIVLLTFSAMTTVAQTPPTFTCGAVSVVSYTPGLRSNGTRVEASHLDASRALGMAQNTQSLNHVALGLGGSIVLNFAPNYLLNLPGMDVRVWESSGWNAPYAEYPEQADVYASQDGFNWVMIGTSYQDGIFDLGALPYATYIRVVDTTSALLFHGNIDGFDLDAVESTTCSMSLPPTPTPIPQCNPGMHLLPSDFYVNEGGSYTFGVILIEPPPFPGEVVTISVASYDSTQVSITPASRMLDATNWNTGRHFTLTALDDADDEGDLYIANATFYVTSTRMDSCHYNFAAPNLLVAHIYDND